MADSTKPRRASLALGIAMAMLWAAPAGAQDITVSPTEFTGRAAGTFTLDSLAMIMGNPISQGECDAGAIITLRLTGVDTTRSTLQFYQGALCDDVMVRNSTTDGRCSELAVGPFATQNRSMPPDLMVGVGDLVPCGMGGSGVITVWILAVNNAQSDEVAGAGQKVSFPIAYDFQGPPAPADFTATGGEATASLSWTASTDQVTSYEVYMDPSGCGGISDPPDPSLLVGTVEGTSSSYSLPFPDGVATPGEAAVAIRAVDLVGNVSALSNVVCVSRFTVTTWWEAYCGTSTTGACAGSGCSVGPTTPARPPVALGLLVGLAMALALVRRRNR